MTSEDHVKVLTQWPSHYSMRVLIGLEEKGVRYESVEQNLPVEKSPLLLEMNPVYKKIPVLIHNGRPVAESLIALEYMDETWTSPNAPRFLPSHPYDRALARFWADFVNKKVYDVGTRIFRSKGEEQEAANREFVESLVILEGVIDGKDYFGGDVFGLVDIMLAPLISRFQTLETVGKFTIPFEEKCPSIVRWMKKCKERESVNKALPQSERLLEFAKQLRKRFVDEEA